MESVLHDVYYDLSSPAAYSGVYAVYKEAKKRFPRIKLSNVEDFLERQETYTLHKPIKRNFKRNKYFAVGVDTDWQADLCDMQKLSKYNQGYKYILTVVDVFSRYAWAVAIKNKKPETVAAAFNHILKKSGRKPWRLYTDKGTEFRGKAFQQFLDKMDIQYLSSESPDVKAGMAERYNRTLKSRLWKYFTDRQTFKYLDILEQVADGINHTYNSSTERRPVDVTLQNENEVRKTLYGPSLLSVRPRPKFKFAVGDKVRIAKNRHTFKKGYLPNFTEEIFTITDRIPKEKPVYRIKDYENEPIAGIFYEPELVKAVKADEVYKIEKVLKRRKRKGKTEYFVKWLGYPDKFNQWIEQSNLQTIS